MKTTLVFTLAITLALSITGCASRQSAVQSTPEPLVTIPADEQHASLAFRTVGGAGDHPVSYSTGPSDAGRFGMQSAGERVYDTAYFKRIPGYLKKMAGGTSSIDTLVEANKPLKVNALVKQQVATLNGIPMHSMFGYAIAAQPETQVFTPKPKTAYLIETVIADNYVMTVYEITGTGERKPVSVVKSREEFY